MHNEYIQENDLITAIKSATRVDRERRKISQECKKLELQIESKVREINRYKSKIKSIQSKISGLTREQVSDLIATGAEVAILMSGFAALRSYAQIGINVKKIIIGKKKLNMLDVESMVPILGSIAVTIDGLSNALRKADKVTRLKQEINNISKELKGLNNELNILMIKYNKCSPYQVT